MVTANDLNEFDARPEMDLTEEDKEWVRDLVLERLIQYGKTAEQQGLTPKTPPKVSISIMRGTPIIRYGREQLGRLSIEDIVRRNAESIDSLFDLNSALTLPFVFSDLSPEISKSIKNTLYTVARALASGLQEIFRTQFRAPVDSDKLATEAYRICNPEIEKYLASQKDTAARLAYPASSIVATFTKDYANRWNKWAKTESFEKSPPWPKATGFPVGSDSFSLKIISQDEYLKLYPEAKKLPKEIALLSFRILGRKSGLSSSMTVRVTPRGGSDWATLKKCLSSKDGYDVAQGRIILDEGRWVFKLGYSKPRPKPGVIESAMVVIPAMNSLAVVISSDAKVLRGRSHSGEDLPKGIDSSAFLAMKEKLDAMKSSRARHLHFAGPSARGHGKKRLRASLVAVEVQATNYIKTWMEQQASHIARHAKSIGAAVFVDDMVSVPHCPDRNIERLLRRFPWCTFRDKILWACEKEGVFCRAAKHSGTYNCPMCGAEKSIQASKHGRIDGNSFAWCAKCDAENTYDIFRAWRIFKICLSGDNLNIANDAFVESTETTKSWLDKANGK